jgi:hypothetical protein
MKKIISVLVFLVGIGVANAQFSKNNALYFGLEPNIINFNKYSGIEANINYVYKEKYSFKLGCAYMDRDALSRPSDYLRGYSLEEIIYFPVTLLLDIAGKKPIEKFSSTYLSVGRVCKLDKKGKLRLNMNAGVGITTILEPRNWRLASENDPPRHHRSRYTWDDYEYNTISLTINPKIEYLPSHGAGFTLSPIAHLTEDKTSLGIHVGMILGILRQKPTAKVLPQDDSVLTK